MSFDIAFLVKMFTPIDKFDKMILSSVRKSKKQLVNCHFRKFELHILYSKIMFFCLEAFASVIGIAL